MSKIFECDINAKKPQKTRLINTTTIVTKVNALKIVVSFFANLSI